MNNHKDEWFELGPDACATMGLLYFEKLVPDDTVESLKHSLQNIDGVLDVLGRDKTSPHYDNEMSLRKALVNIKSVLQDKISQIEIATKICENIILDVDSVCNEEAFNYFFLVKYRDMDGRRA